MKSKLILMLTSLLMVSKDLFKEVFESEGGFIGLLKNHPNYGDINPFYVVEIHDLCNQIKKAFEDDSEFEEYFFTAHFDDAMEVFEVQNICKMFGCKLVLDELEEKSEEECAGDTGNYIKPEESGGDCKEEVPYVDHPFKIGVPGNSKKDVKVTISSQKELHISLKFPEDLTLKFQLPTTISEKSITVGLDHGLLSCDFDTKPEFKELEIN